MRHTVAAAPIAPIFRAGAVTLHVSREKNGKSCLMYAGWDDAKIVQPDEVLEQARSREDGIVSAIPGVPVPAGKKSRRAQVMPRQSDPCRSWSSLDRLYRLADL
jgi:hypothetical protein